MADYSNRLTISYNALKRARRTIADFVQSYFPLHSLDVVKFFDWLDIFIFVEGCIYQADEENEKLCNEELTIFPLGLSPVLAVLKKSQLDIPELLEELSNGLEYWAGEQMLCLAMKAHLAVPIEGHDPGFSVQQVLGVSRHKSFDYRVLHYLLHALLKKTPDPALLLFLRLDEELLDIGDDLVDYEEDILANSFNIYRCYVHLYGLGAQMKLIEYISGVEQRHAAALEGLPEKVQEVYRKRQKEAAEGERDAAGALKWVFPHPILDEGKYREEHSNDS